MTRGARRIGPARTIAVQRDPAARVPAAPGGRTRCHAAVHASCWPIL
ncbi:hypothetical protein OH687_02775 [Burkholderia anthina]|nr:hypothetical protein OH687_02775 [Burkholderia anthina]